MKAPTRKEVRLLLGELPQCAGVGGFGCGTREATRPAIVFIDGMGRHVCNACADQIEADVRVDSPIASLVRAWLAELSSANDVAVASPVAAAQ